MDMKHCKVEVYLLELKLSMYSNQNQVVTKEFSRGATVGKITLKSLYLAKDMTFFLIIAHLELEARKTFSVSESAQCKVWHHYMTNTYELLSNLSQTLQDAGLYNGQVRMPHDLLRG